MDQMLAQVQKWREAHPDIQIPEEALKVAGPWPSLFANDFVVMLESRGTMPEIAQFVKDMAREMAWTYGAWDKALHDSDPGKLMIDLMNNAKMPDYAFTLKFLSDYAKANNIPIGKQSGYASWENLLTDFAAEKAAVIPAGTSTVA